MVHGLAVADSKLAGKADIERWKTHWKAYRCGSERPLLTYATLYSRVCYSVA